jgi:type IV secretion system protein VirD4
VVMLTQLLLAARKEHAPPFPYVRQLIRLGLTDAARWVHAVDPALATQLLDSRFEEMEKTDRFLLSAWSTLSARLRPLLTETLVRCFTKSDFSAADLLLSKQPVTVYLRWPERDLLALAPLVRLMWDSLIGELITTYDNVQGEDCQPVLLLQDEAACTAIPALAERATTVVGRGISLWVAIQSLSQLETVYGKARAQTLRDNMDSQIYYRPTDLATAAYLEERLGSVSAYAKSISLRDGEETGEGRAERPIPLLSAQQILQLPEEDIIAFHRNLPPMRLNRMDWRQHPELVKRHNLKLPDLPSLPPVPETAFPQLHRETTSGYIDMDERN